MGRHRRPTRWPPPRSRACPTMSTDPPSATPRPRRSKPTARPSPAIHAASPRVSAWSISCSRGPPNSPWSAVKGPTISRHCKNRFPNTTCPIASRRYSIRMPTRAPGILRCCRANPSWMGAPHCTSAATTLATPPSPIPLLWRTPFGAPHPRRRPTRASPSTPPGAPPLGAPVAMPAASPHTALPPSERQGSPSVVSDSAATASTNALSSTEKRWSTLCSPVST